jgi:hypothetical protein
MDLSTYLLQSNFKKDIEDITADTKYHNLIYHASGGLKDPQVIINFQNAIFTLYYSF